MLYELEAFESKNYKPFVDTEWINIKPITLAFGHNSSGKSALLNILPMLQQTIDDPNMQTPFIFASETGVDLGSYEEVIHNHNLSLDHPIWFNLKFSQKNINKNQVNKLSDYRARTIEDTFKKLNVDHKQFTIEVAASYNKKQRQIAITDYYLKSVDQDKTILRIYRKTTAANQAWHFMSDVINEVIDFKVAWYHFLPIIFSSSAKRKHDNRAYHPYDEISYIIREIVVSNLRQLIHIGPLREFPQRAYRLTGESPRDVGPRGEYWLNILLKEKDRDSLTNQVNSWLKRLGYSMRIEWGKQGYVHPMLKDKRGLEVSLKDTGFGISQLLPVLIQGFSCAKGTILILEQPEIHLHPKAQAELGDMLIAVAKRGVKLLIETHSEHLLLRLQRRIAESTLNNTQNINPEDVALYFIENIENHSKVHEVKVNEKGEFVEPPENFSSFFSDDFDETVQWSKTIAKLNEGDN